MNYFITIIVCAILFTATSCDKSSSFRGTWEYTYSDEDSECAYTLWLDPIDKTVNQGGYENVIGVIRAYEDAGGQYGTSYNQITEFAEDGNTAEIKYLHKETGEIHRAKLTLDTSGSELRWEYAGLYKTGPNSPREDNVSPAEGPAYLEPADAELLKTNDSPNYKQIQPENIVMELPDRTYYIEDGIFSEQAEDGSWIEHIQLRCYVTDDCTDWAVLDETYTWGDTGSLNISDVWPANNNKGLYFTRWDGGSQFQTIYLYKTDGMSKAVQLDEVDGLRFNPLNEDVSDADIPSIIKEEDKIIVYDPSKKETREYDL